jgi:hypothetical protein
MLSLLCLNFLLSLLLLHLFPAHLQSWVQQRNGRPWRPVPLAERERGAPSSQGRLMNIFFIKKVKERKRKTNDKNK